MEKKKVLNAALCVYVMNVRMAGFKDGDNDASSMMQPGTLQKELKHIFKCFKDSSIYYEQSEFKSMAGSYLAVVNKMIQETGDRKFIFVVVNVLVLSTLLITYF